MTVTRRVAGLVLAALTMSGAACSAPVPEAAWSFEPVEVPVGVVPRRVAALDDGILLAGQDSAEAPPLHLLRDDEFTAIPLTRPLAMPRQPRGRPW